METKQVNVAMPVEMFDALKVRAHEMEMEIAGQVVTIPEAIRRILEESLINGTREKK
jgi:hypothetical protein